MELLMLDEVADVFADAIVSDNDNQLLFLSLWGQDTSLQELLARLSLPNAEGGLRRLILRNETDRRLAVVSSIDQFDKHTGRAPAGALFQGLSHLWLYDRLAIEPDRANRRCLVLRRPEESEQAISQRLWQTVRDMCHVPLLEEWQEVMSHFQQRGWIRRFSGIGMDAYRIDLSSREVEQLISQLVKAGALSLQPGRLAHEVLQ
jgi:hypothetical protein